MKITDVKAYVVQPETTRAWGGWMWTFVVVETDSGLWGWGESSSAPGKASPLTAEGVRACRESLVGEDPANIERLWQKVYRRFTYLGSRGFPTTVLSGIDMALWDIQGKRLGAPVYELLGGKVHDSVRLYANSWFAGCLKPAEFGRAASAAVAAGHDALKLDPFLEMQPHLTSYVSGQITSSGEDQGCAITRAIRDAIGPRVELLIDAHGHYDVPTAIRLANRLYDESRIGWFEEPVPPESLPAMRAVRERARAPLCVGERLFTRHDFLPILEGRLAEYIMPDVCWTGGISELKKIATMAEAYHIPISPHNAQGPGQILAGAHVGITTPNFYRLEHGVAQIPDYNAFLVKPIAFEGSRLHLPDGPGLGIDLNLEKVRACAITDRS